MIELHKGKFLKLCEVFSLSLILSSAVSSVIAEESFYRFPTGEQEGGGVRGEQASCKADNSYPVPLIPQNERAVTALASPKLFFDASSVHKPIALDFLMLDEENEIVYQSILEADRQSNLVSLELSPENGKNQLEIDNAYHWYLIEDCGELATPNILAAGSLQRIEPPAKLTQKIANASRVEQINLYQEADMWYEAVESMSQLQCQFTDSLTDKIATAVDTTSQLIDRAEGDRCVAIE